MLSKKIEILTRALQRERKAKEIAEGIIENRLRELYDSNQSLTQDIIQKEEFQKNLIQFFDPFFLYFSLFLCFPSNFGSVIFNADNLEI